MPPPPDSPSPPDPASPLAALLPAVGPRHRTATEYVEETLRTAILSGALPGGTPLRQEELAALFGVSRMPVREALRQLEAQALIDFEPHKGAVVIALSAEDAADTYAIRQALEPMALRLSVPHLTPADLARAATLIDDMDAETDPARLGPLNRHFHMTLYARAGRPRLLALTAQHMATADRYLSFHLTAFGRDRLSQDEHHAMLAACRRGDGEAACVILAAHMAEAERTLLAYLEARIP